MSLSISNSIQNKNFSLVSDACKCNGSNESSIISVIAQKKISNSADQVKLVLVDTSKSCGKCQKFTLITSDEIILKIDPANPVVANRKSQTIFGQLIGKIQKAGLLRCLIEAFALGAVVYYSSSIQKSFAVEKGELEGTCIKRIDELRSQDMARAQILLNMNKENYEDKLNEEAERVNDLTESAKVLDAKRMKAESEVIALRNESNDFNKLLFMKLKEAMEAQNKSFAALDSTNVLQARVDALQVRVEAAENETIAAEPRDSTAKK